MNTQTIEKSFCTTREAATLLGVSVGTVQLWVESGRLQAWKTAGGHRRVMRESVDSLLRKVPAAPTPQSDTPRKLTVMVVEDDATLLRLYEAKISRWPMAPKMIGVDNAFAALLMMGTMNPDLLITDLQMPGMDGFNMLKVLHNAPESAYTTIVVVSGLDAADIEAKGGVPKGIEVLPKPIPFDRLCDIAIGITTAKRLGRSAV